MSKKQGFVGKASNVAFHTAAIRNIINALMQGGWSSAASQALRHYWPQILTVTLFFILLPVIIICCLPMMMFGFESSIDNQISEMTSQAEAISDYFDNYDKYCKDRMDEIKKEIKDYQEKDYEIIDEGEYMPKNWFIALFSVSVDNDLTNVTEQQIIDFLDNCIFYEIETQDDENTESNTVTIKRLTAEEVMEYMNYSDSDKNWVTLIYNTLESEETDGNNSTYSN